jgi:hypothetical protein
MALLVANGVYAAFMTYPWLESHLLLRTAAQDCTLVHPGTTRTRVLQLLETDQPSRLVLWQNTVRIERSGDVCFIEFAPDQRVVRTYVKTFQRQGHDKELLH